MFKEFLKGKGISEDDFAKKTPQEMAELHSEFSSKNIASLKEEMGKAIKQEDIDKAIKAFGDAQEKSMEEFIPKSDFETMKTQVSALVKDLEEANKEILTLTEQGSTMEEISLKGSIRKALKDNYDDFKTFFEENKKTGKGNFEIQVKVPEIVTTQNITPTGAANVYAAQSVSSYSEYLYGYIYLESFLDVGSTGLASIPYVDEVPGEGDAEIVLEGALKPLIDVDFVTAFSQAVKVAGRMKATEEALYDYGWLESAMESTLKKKHDIARQGDVLTRVLALATPFNAAILADISGVTDPQHYDVIASLSAGMANSSEGHYVPNVMFINTMDNLDKKLNKDGNNNYIMPPFSDANGNVVDGVTIVANPSVTVGTFVIGDMRNIKVRNVWGYTVRFGWENDDFSRNQITMIGESRYHVYATTNDRRGIITGNLADVEAAIV